jgi:hypothetical protein
MISISVFSQKSISFVKALPQQTFHRSVAPGNYSGLTRINGNRYAVVDDKSSTDGFYIFDIDIDSVSGKIKTVSSEGFRGNGERNRDGEGIAFVPFSNTIFISGEGDRRICEYRMDGMLTSRCLDVPDIFKKSSANYGFEALAYNQNTRQFWTTTESMLPSDGVQSTSTNGARNMLRLQSFNENLCPFHQYAYLMEAPIASSVSAYYAMGVSDMVALDDGRLIVLEREFFVPPSKFGAFANCKLFVVNPSAGKEICDKDTLSLDSSPFLIKTLLYEFKTTLSLFNYDIANYEGLCLGPKLVDGTQTLIMVSDSQNQYYGVLKDWFKVLLIKE